MSAPRRPLTFAGAVWVSVGSMLLMVVLIAGGIAAGVLVPGPLGVTLAIILLALGPLTALLVPNLVLRRRYVCGRCGARLPLTFEATRVRFPRRPRVCPVCGADIR